ncbi:MAG TPA: phosphate signaling complex protein PhoU, partial [Bdellovibrionota bacterium]|nr:phosphate signaling complex protein PhoU [Bdellovibrionota bacterium]
MERHFDASLRQLKERLTAMAALAEDAIDVSARMLQKKDTALVSQVFETEEKINEAQKAVDEACLKQLALQQPLANDLRLVVAVLRINTDLERIGDQAVNIALNSERYLKGPPLKPLQDLPIMVDEARHMVREAIDSFVQGSEATAREVLKRDDKVDALKGQIFRDVIEHMKATPALIEQGLCLIL